MAETNAGSYSTSLFDISGGAPPWMSIKPNIRQDFTGVDKYLGALDTLHQRFMEQHKESRPPLEGYQELVAKIEALPGDHTAILGEMSSAISGMKEDVTQFHGYWGDYLQTDLYKDKVEQINKALVNVGSAKLRLEDWRKGYDIHRSAGTLGEKAVIEGNYLVRDGEYATVNDLYKSYYDPDVVVTDLSGNLMNEPYDQNGYFKSITIDSNTSTMKEVYSELADIFGSVGYTGMSDNSAKLSAIEGMGTALPVLLNTSTYVKTNKQQLNAAVDMLLNSGLSPNATTGLMRAYDPNSGEDFSSFVAEKVRDYARTFENLDIDSKQTAKDISSSIGGGGGEDAIDRGYFFERAKGSGYTRGETPIVMDNFIYREDKSTGEMVPILSPRTVYESILPLDKQEKLYSPGMSMTNFGTFEVGGVDIKATKLPSARVWSYYGGGRMEMTVPDGQGGYRPWRSEDERFSSTPRARDDLYMIVKESELASLADEGTKFVATQDPTSDFLGKSSGDLASGELRTIHDDSIWNLTGTAKRAIDREFWNKYVIETIDHDDVQDVLPEGWKGAALEGDTFWKYLPIVGEGRQDEWIVIRVSVTQPESAVYLDSETAHKKYTHQWQLELKKAQAELGETIRIAEGIL